MKKVVQSIFKTSKKILKVLKRVSLFQYVLMFTIFTCSFILYSQYQNIDSLKNKEHSLIVEKQEKKQEKKSLEKEVEFLYNDESYLIKYARSHYFFVKEGEKVLNIE